MRIAGRPARVLESAAIAVACLLLGGCGRGSGTRGVPADTHDGVQRGKYLVTVAGCNECHTTKTFGPDGPQPDTSRLLAGHPEQMKMPPPPRLPPHEPWAVVASPTLTAWSGPWGVSFAANLTPDQNTGLGTPRCGPANTWASREPFCRRCRGRTSRGCRTRTWTRFTSTSARFHRSSTTCPTRFLRRTPAVSRSRAETAPAPKAHGWLSGQ